MNMGGKVDLSVGPERLKGCKARLDLKGKVVKRSICVTGSMYAILLCHSHAISQQLPGTNR